MEAGLYREFWSGLLGSVVASWMVRGGNPAAGMPAVIATWAMAGCAIGLVSAMMERKPSRIAGRFTAGAWRER